MALAERAHALAGSGFATMVRRNETPKKEDKMENVTQPGPNAEDKAANKFRTADLLQPVIWGCR
jgi:hypothetical protein